MTRILAEITAINKYSNYVRLKISYNLSLKLYEQQYVQ